jgi:hypothetical protein
MQSGSFFEPLEGRRLLSATITSTAGGLVVTDDNNGNNVFVQEVSPGNVQVFVNFQSQGVFTAPANNVIVNGGNGGDTITFQGITVGATLLGGTGKDVLHAFSLGGVPITMNGGNGNDQIFDDQGPAIILAGNGKDSVFLNNLSQATIDGGNGPDGIFITIDPGDPLGLNSQTADVQSTGKGSGTIDITTTQTPPFGPTTSFTMESTFVNVSSVYVNGVRVA